MAPKQTAKKAAGTAKTKATSKSRVQKSSSRASTRNPACTTSQRTGLRSQKGEPSAQSPASGHDPADGGDGDAGDGDGNSGGDDPGNPRPGFLDREHEPSITFGQASHTMNCSFGTDRDARQDGWLTGLLRVHADPHTDNSRLGYKASFYLHQSADEDPVEIGWIDAWRIDRRTASRPYGTDSWRAAFLQLDTRLPAANLSAHETALCLQALFSRQGKPRRGGQLDKQLRQDGLLFLELVYVSEVFQGQGLLKHMLHCFREMLLQLPQWLAFHETLLLVPARPEGGIGESWGPVMDRTVENNLIQIYQRADGFQVYNRNAAVGDVVVSVMGRRVLEPDSSRK